MNSSAPSRFYIYLTIFLSMCLSVVPISNTLSAMAPQWVLLTLLFWGINVPNKVSLGTSWVSGLLMDVLTNATLGHHALLLCLATYLGVLIYERIRHYTLWQQTSLMLAFFFAIQCINYLLIKTTSETLINGLFWLTVVSSAMCWPLLHSVFKLNRQHIQAR